MVGASRLLKVLCRDGAGVIGRGEAVGFADTDLVEIPSGIGLHLCRAAITVKDSAKVFFIEKTPFCVFMGLYSIRF